LLREVDRDLAEGQSISQFYRKVVDQAIEMLGETDKVPDVYREEQDKEGFLA